MKAIETRYLSPTDRRGSRIKATDSDGNTITTPWNSAQDSEKNHQAAAVALCHKMNWTGVIQGGYTKDGMVWVFSGGPIYAIQ